MMNELEAQRKKVCCNCEDSIAGELNKLQMENYRTTALCPECWMDSVKTKSKGNEKIPLQMGLPLIGEMPAIIQMSPVTFGLMASQESKLLRDCIIRSVYRGSICYFDIICPTLESGDAIRKYLTGRNV